MARRGAGETTVTPELVLRAYRAGLFPMAERRDADRLYWLDPDRRGIQPLDSFHLPRRLARTVLSGAFEVRCDSAFAAVLEGCAEPTEDRPETWINADIERLFGALHEMGHAHSVECWQEGRLVGGLFGVTVGGLFSGESMFHRVTDASKAAMAYTVQRLKQRGFTLFDVQWTNPHTRRMGARDIPRSEYLRRLEAAIRLPVQFVP